MPPRSLRCAALKETVCDGVGLLETIARKPAAFRTSAAASAKLCERKRPVAGDERVAIDVRRRIQAARSDRHGFADAADVIECERVGDDGTPALY
ncbi:MAG TPA: hypothetical protein VKH35_04475 [Thermoanaerobaculia bacterium]|nr:hypothetical protein [Thermoanaerobaculia bacterium]